MAISRAELVELTREVMDAVDSTRWSDTLIKSALNVVYDDEWSNLLNATQYYTYAMRTVTTDANGVVDFTSLNSGGGDSQENFYRILSVSDGNVLYTQTRFQDVPLATTTNYLPTYPRLYYIVGEQVQILPVASGTSLFVAVNYKPTSLYDLLSDASTITFPLGGEWIIANEAGARLLNKGGAESGAAQVLKREAAELRMGLLDDIRRRTINPTLLAYPDQKHNWASC
ncbi:MAG: hypothetical protein FJW30_29010 [Acidobacteria bacterium]|nr:hypothetical protein [Acidobacteriota bacterium]